MKAMQCEQESHGDWLATEHNSAVANNLKQKYGEQITIMMIMMIVIILHANVVGIKIIYVQSFDNARHKPR